jgi:antitoxin component YwqK of YwqJK toxin-antitoxin module
MSKPIHFAKSTILIIILIFLSRNLFSQDSKNIVREVEIKTKDSTIKAQILLSRTELDFKKDCKYYWYHEGQIHFNQSGIAGLPLHGNYSVFDNKGNMITSGQFHYGAQDGKWLYWSSKGNLRKIVYYKNGKLSGTPEIYDQPNKGSNKEKSSFFTGWLKKEKKAKTDTVTTKSVAPVVKIDKAQSDTTKVAGKKSKPKK